MIPVSMDEKITYTDEDGTAWEFKPRTGILERESMFTVRHKGDAETRSAEEILTGLSAFIDKIVIGWNKKPDGSPSDILNYSEQWKVLDMWEKSGRLTVEEKKV